MAVQIPTPVIHVYKEINAGKYISTKHYELQDVLNGKNHLTQLLNLSKDRKCAKSSPVLWLQTHNGKKWVKPRLTGLFKHDTEKLFKDSSNTFKGDSENKKNLLIFRFLDKFGLMLVFYFKDYYTKDIKMPLKVVQSAIKQQVVKQD